MKAGGSFERRTACEPAELALGLPEFLERREGRPAFEQEGDEQHDIGDDRRHRLLGIGDVDDAFVDRHAGAEREHQDGDDEAPEIELAAVAERVDACRPACATAWRPHISSSWLVESTTLWTPSVSIADEPVIAAATNLDDGDAEVGAEARSAACGCCGAAVAQMWITRPNAASTLSCIISLTASGAGRRCG